MAGIADQRIDIDVLDSLTVSVVAVINGAQNPIMGDCRRTRVDGPADKFLGSHSLRLSVY